MSERILHSRLLGLLELTLGGEALPLPSSAKARSLLAYLILHHDSPIPRDRLLGIFWPERPDARARRALSQELWRVRSALGPAADRLVVEREAITFSLHPGDRLDVAEFEQLVRQAGESSDRWSLDAGVDLYRGDFLEGMYDDWALLERERLRERYLRALEGLVALHKQQGDYGRTLACAQRLVQADPLREEAHRELMRLYHLQGRSEAALEQFELLNGLLEIEMGAPPSSATVALYREIAREFALAAGEVASVHLPEDAPLPILHDLARLPFVGRERERAALLNCLQAALQGSGGHALIEGDAGVGKTRFVGEIVSDAQWRGFQVGFAKAEQLAASSPYQLLCDALTPLMTPLHVTQLAKTVEPVWLSVVASVCPLVAECLPDLLPLASLEPHEEQRRLWEGVARCLSGLAAIVPFLLILEDVHWADEATLTVLVHLAPRLAEMRAFVVFTARPAEVFGRESVWHALEAIDRASPLRRLCLEPFTSVETIELVARALGVEDGLVADFSGLLQDGTGGNALCLVESLKSLVEQGALAPNRGEGWRLPPAGELLPALTTVQGLVTDRLARLDAPLHAVLDLVAVLGEDGDFPVLSRASDLEAAALPAMLEDLRWRGLLVESGAGYRFEHDRVREIAYETIVPKCRRRLHQKAGLAMEEVHPDRVESLAYHFRRAEVWGKAADFSKRAGDRARAVYANTEAAEHYGQALEALERHSGSPDLDRVFELRLDREAVYALQGERAAQAKDLAALEALAEQMDDDQRRIEVILRRVCYLHALGDYSVASEVAQRVIDLAGRTQDVGGEAAGRFQLGAGHWLQGNCEAAQPELEQALTLAQMAQTLAGKGGASVESLRQMEGDCLRLLGNVCGYRSDHAEAIAYYERSLHICRAIKDRQGEGKALGNIGSMAYDQGDYAKSKACSEQALSIMREIGDRQTEANTLTNLGFTAVEQGDYARGRVYLDQALQIYREIKDRHGEGWLLNYVGQFAVWFGDYAGAASTCEQALSLCQQVGDRLGEAWGLANLSLYAHSQGEDETAREYGQQAVQITQELGERFCRAYALKNLGHALGALGQLADAVDAYQQSLALRRELGQLNLAMDPLAGLARIYLAQGNTTQAQMCVEEILDYMETQTHAGINAPFRIYLTCYRVLCANQDPRAGDVLETAHRLLQEQASKMGAETMQRAYLENVAAHREIIAAYRGLRGHRVQFRLPRADVPATRPPNPDEWVEISWTVDVPGDTDIPDKVDRRRHRLLRLLREAADQAAAPTIQHLAQALGVGERTIRRDLAALRAQGHDVRTRGARSL